MILEGDRSVIDALKEKKRLMEAGEPHEHINILCIVDGGFMKGSYAVGAGVAFESLGYTKAFSNVVGISSGAISAAYFVASEVFKGKRIISEECCIPEFLSWRRWVQEDAGYLIQSVRTDEEKALSSQVALSSVVSLHIGVSAYETGEPELLQPTTEAELFAALQATISMPTVCTEPVVIDEVRYVDGCFASPYVVQKAVDEIPASHILIFTSQDCNDSHIKLPERLLNKTVFRKRLSTALRQTVNRRADLRRAAYEQVRNQSTPAAFVWGDGSVGALQRDGDLVRSVIERSRQWWCELLSE